MNLEDEIESMLAIQAGQTALLLALIQTHPDATALQLATVSSLEMLLNGAAGQVLSEPQRDQAREYTETLRSVQPHRYEAPVKIQKP